MVRSKLDPAGRDDASSRDGIRSILFIAHTAGVSGPTHSLRHLVRGMQGRYRMGVLAPGQGPLTEMLRPLGVEVHVMPHRRFTSVARIMGLIRRERYDLVYGNNPSRISRNALIAAKATGRPFIWHFRGMKHHWGWKRGVFLRWADRIVAVSAACAQPLRRFRPQDDIAVIHNGVDTAAFRGGRAEAWSTVIEEFGLDSEARLILTASHVTPRKGIDLGLAAFGNISSDLNAHWLIAGSVERSPEFVDAFRRRIQSSGLDGRVHLLGLRSDVPVLMRAADVFLHPAVRDPHPRAVLEAMASELPVVAFDVDGVAETVVHASTGYLAQADGVEDLGASLARLLSNDAQRREFGIQGRQRVQERFTAARTAQAVSALIESCFAPPNPMQTEEGAAWR